MNTDWIPEGSSLSETRPPMQFDTAQALFAPGTGMPAVPAHPASAPRRGLSQRVLALTCSHMETSVGRKITLGELAGTAGFSRFYFSRLFRVSTGESPMGYFLRLRIERAKKMLVQGDLQMCQIAIALGFFDQSHFTRTFRRMTGVTPGEYVRLCRIAAVAV